MRYAPSSEPARDPIDVESQHEPDRRAVLVVAAEPEVGRPKSEQPRDRE